LIQFREQERTCGLYYKSFTIVIHEHNNNGLYYKTTIIAYLATIIAILALARSVNYICKVRCKPKCTFMIVNYDTKPFIVQATRGNFIKLFTAIKNDLSPE